MAPMQTLALCGIGIIGPMTALDSPAQSAPPRPRPQSLTDLFMAFTWLALQGFGGVVAVVQRVLVEQRQWLTREEFIEDWAVSQVMPGPNVINLALIVGDRYFGLRGAFCAAAGMLCAPLVVVVSLVLLYTQYAHVPQVAGALKGMAAVAAGLITATGIKLYGALKSHPTGLVTSSLFAATSFCAAAWFRVPLAMVIFGIGGMCCLVTYWRLR